MKRIGLLVAVMMSVWAWAAWAGDKVPANDLPDDFFWKVIGGACVVVVAVVGYQTRQRDALLDKVAGIVYGNENSPGMLTRMTLIEDRIDRCPECSGNAAHQRQGDVVPHYHRRNGE